MSKSLSAQDLSYSKPGSNFYKEMANPAATPTEQWMKITKAVNVSFASDNVRYPKEIVPLTSEQTNWNGTAWNKEHFELMRPYYTILANR